MVLLNINDTWDELTRLQACRRMPVLCSLSKSLGWRLLTESCEDRIKGLKTHYFDITAASGSNEHYLTSMALSEETGIIAIGSGSKEGNLYFVRDTFTTPCLMPNFRFRPVYKENLGSPIYSLNWSGNHLLVGMTGGITRIYKVQFNRNESKDEYTFEKISLIGEYINPIHKTDIYASCYTTNLHVKSADFSPSYSSNFVDANKDVHVSETPFVPSRFLSLTANKISIWDALQEKAPLSSIKASKNPLNCASWSPNQPQSLVVCGGVDKELKIIDTRMAVGDEKGIVWRAKNAHDRSIRDAKFSPFIPYWLASAGEDAIVNIWDIRATYHAPVAKIDGHYSMVSSISWSRIRPENILTGSFDGTVRFWALSPNTYPIWDTHYRLGNYSENDSLPLISGSTARESSSKKRWSRQSNGYLYASKMESWLSDGDSIINQQKSTMMLVGGLGLGEWGRREPGPIYKGEPIVEARGAVVSIMSASPHSSLYYCITDGGQLTSQSLRSDITTNIKCNHYQYDLKSKNGFAREIEDDIYCRKISDARGKLETLKSFSYDNEEDENQKIKAVEFLEDCLEEIPPIESNSWSIDSIPESLNPEELNSRLTDNDRWEYSINVFKEELRYWDPRLPPGYKYTETDETDESEPDTLSDYDNGPITSLPQFPLSNNSLNSKNTDNSHYEGYLMQINRNNLVLDDVECTTSSINSTSNNMERCLNEPVETSENEDNFEEPDGFIISSTVASSPRSIYQEPYATIENPEPSIIGKTESLPIVAERKNKSPVVTEMTVLSAEPTTPVIASASPDSSYVTETNPNNESFTPSAMTDTIAPNSKQSYSINTNPFIVPTSVQSTNPFESNMTGLGIQPIKSIDNCDRQSVISSQSLESNQSASSKLQDWFSSKISRSRSRNTIDGDGSSSKSRKPKLNFFKNLKSRTHSNTVTPGTNERVKTPDLQSQSTGRRENHHSRF